MFRKFLAASTIVFGLMAGGASAADIKGPVYKAPPAVFNWSGFYVGGHVGGIGIEGDFVAVGAGSDDGSGIIGGALAGYNWHVSRNWVFGIEVDGGFSGADFNAAVVGPAVVNSELKWNAHVRGRLGYAMDRTLLFFAAGLAVANVDQFVPGFGSVDNTLTGYSIGAGLDHAFTPRLIGRVEYLYDDYGTKLYNFVPLGGGTINSSYTTSTVRGALIWRW